MLDLSSRFSFTAFGTSATRAEILKKLVSKEYINLNNKTQIITPSLLGEMVYDTVNNSIYRLLDPQLTASWEKGLTGVAGGTISTEEYMTKLSNFIVNQTIGVKGKNNQYDLRGCFNQAAKYYKK